VAERPPEVLGLLPRRAKGPIADHTLCIACGYDLQALAPPGLCPECGVPIADSLRADLVHADPGYVARLALGAKLAMVGILTRWLGVVLAFLGSVGGIAWLWVCGLALLAAGFASSWVGWWWLGGTRPGERDAHSLRSALFIKLLVLAEFTIALSATLWLFAPTSGPLGAILNSPVVAGLASGVFGPLALLLLCVVALAGLAVGCHRLRVIAIMGRCPESARLLKQLVWLTPTIASVGCVLLGLGPVFAALVMIDALDRTGALLTQVRTLRARLDREAALNR
jgi:hypothetical protein